MVTILPVMHPCDNCMHETVCKHKDAYSRVADKIEEACVDHDGPFTVSVGCDKHRLVKPTERSAY